MYISNVTKDYDNITDYDKITFTNCTNTENESFIIIFKFLLLSTPSSILLSSLISLMLCTLIKTLFHNKKMEKVLYPNHPVRCIITRPNKCGKSAFLTSLI